VHVDSQEKLTPPHSAAQIGEADRQIQTKMPKHLFAGKMKSNGKRDWR
jgi:hypothetical protein